MSWSRTTPARGRCGVKSDDEMARATEFLRRYGENPADPAFNDVSEQAMKVRKLEEADLARYSRRVKGAGMLFPSVRGYRFGPLTFSLIFLCVVVFLFMKMGDDTEPVRKLFFSEYVHSGSWWERVTFAPELRAGELWRLITPIFSALQPGPHSLQHDVDGGPWQHDRKPPIDVAAGAAGARHRHRIKHHSIRGDRKSVV